MPGYFIYDIFVFYQASETSEVQDKELIKVTTKQVRRNTM